MATEENKFLNKEGVKQLWNAVKKIQNAVLDVEVDCDHEYEISGQTGHEYGVAIPDTTQVALTKIQGQTRRYSVNEFKLEDKTETQNGVTMVIKNGVVTLNGTSTDLTYFELGIYNLNGNYTYAVFPKSTSVSIEGDTQFYATDGKGTYIQGVGFSIYQVQTFSVNTDNGKVRFRIKINANNSFNNLVLKPMLARGTYNESTMPYFAIWDNTLANSKANFLSTGKELFNSNDIVDKNNFKFENDEVSIKLSSDNNGAKLYSITVPAGTYTVTMIKTYMPDESADITLTGYIDGQSSEDISLRINHFGIDELNSKTFTLDHTSVVSWQLWQDGNDLSIKFKFHLNYGFTAIINESYNSAIVDYGQELSTFDYQDMNNQIHKNASEIITLNGTENWKIRSEAPSKYFWLTGLSVSKDRGAINIVSNSSILKDAAVDYLWKGDIDNLITAYDYFIAIYKSELTTVEELKAWLQQNPIQLIYKKATETIITYIAPSSYPVYNGGLQQQVIDGKYLPYILTKKYAISVPSQIALNIEMDQQQQEQLDALKQQHDQFEQTTNDSITTIDETLTDLESRVSTAEDYLDQIPTTYATITYVDDEISKLDTSLREYVRTQFGTTEGITSFKRSQIVEANSSFTLAYGEKCVIVGIAPEDYKVSIEIASRQYFVYPYEVISNFSQYTDVKTGTGISTDYEYGPTYKMYVGSTSVNEFVSLGRKTGIGRTYTNYNVQLTVNVKCIVYFYRLS